MEEYSREAMREEDRKAQLLRDMVVKYPLINETPNVASFEEFSSVVGLLRTEFGREGVLFRGQENAKWTLQSTLDRQPNATNSLRDYYQKVNLIIEKLETFSDRKWSRKDFSDLEKIFSAEGDLWDRSLHRGIPHYELVLYLRHLSFPSPLLDWTASPFIAAFFAFERPANVESRAIFVLIERPFLSKGGFVGAKALYSFGPYVATHKRHYLQQAQYTTCASPSPTSAGDWVLHPYEDIANPRDLHQDVILKIVLSNDVRQQVLAALYDYNLTSYSLMGSDESLMSTLAYEAFELDQ